MTASETSTPGLITRTRTVIADGCSTTLTLHLTVLPAVTTTLSETACQTYVWNGVTLYEAGTYEQHFPSANGCDSTVILHLTLHSPDTVHQTGSACNSYTLNGTTYTYSGTYTQHLTGGNGCDSVVILDLTNRRNTPTSTPPSITACIGRARTGTPPATTPWRTPDRTAATAS